MKVKILRVRLGAEYDEVIWDYFVDGTLPNNTQVELFDYQAFNFSNFEGQIINLEISSLFIQKKQENTLLKIRGCVIERDDKYYLINDNGVQIEVKYEDILKESIILSKEDTFYLGRLNIDKIITPTPMLEE